MNTQLALNALSFIPPRYRPHLSTVHTAAQAVKYIAGTPWFQAKSAAAKRSISNSVSSRFSSGNTMSVRNAPSAINYQSNARSFRMHPGAHEGEIVIRHREYITDVSGVTTFGTTGISINPGLATAFPWLSHLAPSFEKYQVDELKVEFIPMKGTNTVGRVAMAIDYDALDSLPSFKNELYAFSGARDGQVWDKLNITGKRCAPKYTRVGTVSGSDLKTYDYGRLIIGVAGTADTSVIGEVFVEYVIRLQIPQPANCPSIQLESSGHTAVGTWFNNLTQVGGTAGVMPFTYGTGTSGLRIDVPGLYILSIKLTDTTTNPGTLSSSGSTATILSQNGTAGTLSTTDVWIVSCSAPGQYVYCQSAGTPSLGGTRIYAARFN